MINLSSMSAEDISAMSGRICAPGIPPKSKDEARRHIEMIRQLMDHERALIEAEAKDTRERREQNERCLKHWHEVVLPDVENQLFSKATAQLWARHGIPRELCGDVWLHVIGNERHIDGRLFELCVTKSRERERAGAIVHAPSSTDAHSHDASRGAAVSSARAMREEDPTFFSPKLSKLESMMQIAVDLPRTIISRSSAAVPQSPRSTSSASSSPRGSPIQSPRGGRHSEERATQQGCSPLTTTASNPSFSVGDTTGVSSSPSSGAGLASSDMLISSMCDDILIARVRKALFAYVEYRPDIGYVQGMSYLAAMLLLHVPDDKAAFVALANLLNKGHFRFFYSVHHQGMGVYISAFDGCLQRCLPELHTNFTVIGVNPQMYVIDWWMSLFSRALPYETAARCWDLYLLDEAYLFRISIAILVYFSPHIHEESALDEVMVFLSKVQRQHVDERRFFAIVDDDQQCGGSLSMMRDILRGWLTEVPPEDEVVEL
ncbi:Hypothetical protein, putative [Bodo saltans]|uniref:Rab-GAP TBC domain-containing protein n=1 Tax=Bodo saltans TaxID=75058 RepID=A0A0S4JJU9_BODSA|nr:Hypothetical protein, putative [Bodo saltans]|eukprot:CUG91735.1 Hypothetical protein, putative [Bodo saltans]